MADHSITFEQIDAAFRGLDLAQHQPGGAAHLTVESVRANPAAAIPNVCSIYKAVRPFLQAAANLPFIPQAWRNGIKAFIAAMDLLCP